MPGREDPRALRGHGDGELEVRGQRPIRGEDRPAVVARAHRVARRRSSSARSPAPSPPRAAARCRRHRVRGLRFLVHVAADAMPDERRTIEGPRASALRWMACETSPRRLPGRHCSTPANSDSLGALEQVGGERARPARPRRCARRRRPSHRASRRRRARSRRRARVRKTPGSRARPSSSAKRRSNPESRGSP